MPRETLEASIQIDAPAATVYDYVADFPRHVEWNEQPVRITALQEGPPSVGSRYSTLEGRPANLPLKDKLMFTIVMPIMKMRHGFGDETIAEITALDPNERVAWSAHLPSERSGDMMRMSWEILLEEHQGGTRVTQKGVVAPPDTSPFKGMVNADMAATVSEGVERNLAQLKRNVESA